MKNNFSTILGSKRKTMSDVHKKTKISRTTLRGLFYEKTENPDTKTVMAICDYLEVTPNEFFGIESKKEAN